MINTTQQRLKPILETADAIKPSLDYCASNEPFCCLNQEGLQSSLEHRPIAENLGLQIIVISIGISIVSVDQKQLVFDIKDLATSGAPVSHDHSVTIMLDPDLGVTQTNTS